MLYVPAGKLTKKNRSSSVHPGTRLRFLSVGEPRYKPPRPQYSPNIKPRSERITALVPWLMSCLLLRPLSAAQPFRSAMMTKRTVLFFISWNRLFYKTVTDCRTLPSASCRNNRPRVRSSEIAARPSYCCADISKISVFLGLDATDGTALGNVRPGQMLAV